MLPLIAGSPFSVDAEPVLDFSGPKDQFKNMDTLLGLPLSQKPDSLLKEKEAEDVLRRLSSGDPSQVKDAFKALDRFRLDSSEYSFSLFNRIPPICKEIVYDQKYEMATRIKALEYSYDGNDFYVRLVKDPELEMPLRLKAVFFLRGRPFDPDADFYEALDSILEKTVSDLSRYEDISDVVEMLTARKQQEPQIAALIDRYARNLYPKGLSPGYPSGVLQTLKAYWPATHMYSFRFMKENSLQMGISDLWKSVILHDDVDVAGKMIDAGWIKGLIHYQKDGSRGRPGIRFSLSPLGFSLCRQDREIAASLVNQGADLYGFGKIFVPLSDSSGKEERYTVKPIIFAAYQNDLELLKLFVKKGAKVRIFRYAGCAPVDAASDPDVKGYLRGLGDEEQPSCNKEAFSYLDCR